MAEPKTFAAQYRDLLWRLTYDYGGFVEELNQRTGHTIRAVTGTSLTIDLEAGILPTIDCRRTFPKSAAAETAWYMLGTQDPAFIDRYAKRLWDKFKEDDGTVRAAYGYRWRRHFDRDQLLKSVIALAKDPSDRRCYVSTWDPREDGLGARGQKNVPCPVGFTLSMLDGRLNSTLLIRSSDVFVGLPYDVAGHAMLMASISSSIARCGNYGVGPLGVMQVAIAHPHLYDSHFEMAEKCVSEPKVQPIVPLLGWSIGQVMAEPDSFVGQYKVLQSLTRWPSYCPVPDVIE
jgi:thymidylate synthase